MNYLKLGVIALFSVVLVSCGSSQIGASSHYISPVSANRFLAVKTAIERPQIDTQDMIVDMVANRTNDAKDLEKSTFTSLTNKAINNIIHRAKSFIGTPYRYGGTSRRGIDCSAFMQKAYQAEGIHLPRVSHQQAKMGMAVERNDLRKGDMIFFSTTSRYRITHVGMVVEVKDGEVYFIHAASSKGVSIAKLSNSYWNKRYRRARRLKQFNSPSFVGLDAKKSVSDLN